VCGSYATGRLGPCAPPLHTPHIVRMTDPARWPAAMISCAFAQSSSGSVCEIRWSIASRSSRPVRFSIVRLACRLHPGCPRRGSARDSRERWRRRRLAKGAIGVCGGGAQNYIVTELQAGVRCSFLVLSRRSCLTHSLQAQTQIPFKTL
jgi:hypothetical protein